MVGRRSLRHVLGETNLERKCRFLFGLMLVLWIGTAFWWVDRIGEKLVLRMTNNKGRELAETFLYELHWEKFESSPEGRKMREHVVGDLLTKRLRDCVFLSDERTFGPNSPEPTNPEEYAADEAAFQRLKKQFMDRAARNRPVRAPEGESPAKLDPLEALGKQADEPAADPIFEMRLSADGKNYYYYQPVAWKKTCTLCHIGSAESFAQSAGESAPESLAFTVAKVSMSNAETQRAVSKTRAILITAGFLTVVLAMLALWVIVRYVIVRPLNHLRDVSDAVAHGSTDIRADIHTGDEFEDLAASFNKMLRHLVETQGELRFVNKDLDAKVDELAQLNMRLYEMNRLKGDFLANMSHELRTPLNSIIGFSEVLQGIESLTDKQRRYAQNIQKSGRVLLDMINDILDLAKLEAGKMELRLSEFSIERVVQAQCDMVRSLSEGKNIDLTVNLESGLPLLYQDQGKIQQILTNLLSNAIKFTPEGGRIDVTVAGSPQGLITLAVADTGVGIAEADREIIFEKFRQGAMIQGPDNLTREFSGTGLGLSIVRELCKLLGGDIEVESELGKGSTFRVKIPWMAVSSTKPNTPLNAKLDELQRAARAEGIGDIGESLRPAETSAG